MLSFYGYFCDVAFRSFIKNGCTLLSMLRVVDSKGFRISAGVVSCTSALLVQKKSAQHAKHSCKEVETLAHTNLHFSTGAARAVAGAARTASGTGWGVAYSSEDVAASVRGS